MASPKTLVATGCSSGLGFELVKQLISQSTQLYNFILGVRNPATAQAAFDALLASEKQPGHKLTLLPLDLVDLKGVQHFASELIERLGTTPIDYLMLNAGISNGADQPMGPNGSRWCETLVVNHLSQHYLTHLLRERLIVSKSRIVIVSSGSVRQVSDPAVLDGHLKAGSGTEGKIIYGESKFVQLLSAHWWRRQLAGNCIVVAVSPGLIPGTNIGKGGNMKLAMDMPDAKPIYTGAKSILAAFTREDFPPDPEQIFLTSWGEWWAKDVYGKTLDKQLQEKWCFSKEDIERDEKLV